MTYHPILFGTGALAGADVHYHECPECHTLPACVEDCTVEPGLGLTPCGCPKGAHVVCQACERARLTSSEVALAKVLASWEEWWRAQSDLSDESQAMGEIGDLVDTPMGLFISVSGAPTARGAALLERARKAGVLADSESACETARGVPDLCGLLDDRREVCTRGLGHGGRCRARKAGVL